MEEQDNLWRRVIQRRLKAVGSQRKERVWGVPLESNQKGWGDFESCTTLMINDSTRTKFRFGMWYGNHQIHHFKDSFLSLLGITSNR